jgi:tetratricopeptide (TPR) repeat protein
LRNVDQLSNDDPVMDIARLRMLLVVPVALVAACASAEDRLNEGIALQSQGRYIDAVYRYAEAIEKDRELVTARERMLAAGDSAVMLAMDAADDLERRGDPVRAADQYVTIDRMLARIRDVGERPILPSDYATIRRAIFDNAIEWQMVRGDEATQEGRWQDARGYYVNARGSYLPSRDQVEASYDAETRLLLRWAEIDLHDAQPRAAYGRAQEALEVRSSPTRETVLAVREIQDRALREGTVVLAVVPVTADPGVREWLGGEFEMRLDSDLGLDHWTNPPLFVEMADPLLLRSELRGLLRGQAIQSPMLVGRALQLIGADLGVMIRVASIEVVEEDVDRDRHETVVERNARRRTVVAGGMAYAMAEGQVGEIASGPSGTDPEGRENEGRGPPEDGNNGRGPRDGGALDPDTCGGNNGRGPPEEGNNGRGPGDEGRPCDDGTPDAPGGDNGDGAGSGGGDGLPGPGENRRSGPEDEGIDSRIGGTGDPAGEPDRRPGAPSVPLTDTVTYTTVRGTMTYHVVAEVLLVDPTGREVGRFTASSTQSGPFERGEFAGDPGVLRLEPDHQRFFDPRVIGSQMAAIEAAVLQELAAALAVGTYDQVLAGIP